MKLKYFSTLFISILFACTTYASDEVYLDLNLPEIHKYNTGVLKIDNNQGNIEETEDYLKPSFRSLKKMYDEDFYSPKTVSAKKEKKLGKNTVGAKYDTTLNPNSATQSRTIYAKHDFTEKMSIDTSYKNNLTDNMNQQVQGTVSVAPECKITEKTSLRNIYSKNLGDKSNKGELQLKYKPFSDDRMDFNVGAGQKTYDDGQKSSSQVNFGTNFRF